MAELLEATKKMTKYFKRALKHIPSHTKINDHYQHKTSISHSDKCKYKNHYHKDEVNEITSETCILMHTPTKTDDTPNNTDIDSSNSTMDYTSDSKLLSRQHSIIEVKLSNCKYAANFPVKVNNKNNQAVSLFDTGATICCMSKACFDKLDPNPC